MQRSELWSSTKPRNYITYIASKGSFTTKLAFKNFNGIEKSIEKIDRIATRVYIIDFQLLKKSLNLKEYEEVVIEDNDGYDTDWLRL